ncbi:MAG: TROVE domain-containing protein [Armatimonadetes bacterium]|nr:TROVE domain-containing protein [Armatimonadota bacterium]CUU34180.1 SS-A/Ro ribonucleoprotein [Armatimonadetes bacterium DC]
MRMQVPRVLSRTQRVALPGQTRNDAGGFAYPLEPRQQLERFLILGTEGGTYYVSEQRLTLENVKAVLELLYQEPAYVLERTATISEQGRAYKNDPALFVLALALASGRDAIRTLALEAMPRIVRTGTHLFTFVDYLTQLRGWGRAVRRAVAHWYQARDLRELAYQVTKYRQRYGWAHRDLLRLAHPKADTAERNALYRYILTREVSANLPAEVGAYLEAVERLNAPDLPLPEAARLIRDYALPREVVPTHLLTSAEVWNALLPAMPMTALIRNLATMTRVGLLTPDSEATHFVVAQLTDRARLRQARVHPLQVLAALVTYERGRGGRGSGVWEPVPAIVRALNGAFYATFENVAPTGKRLVLALDISGSMSWGNVGGIMGLTPRIASAALALVTLNAEQEAHVVGFSHQLMPLKLKPDMPLERAVKYLERLPFGATDCALPMLWALERGVAADAFVIYTDSETWYGEVHPVEALRMYREATGIPARLVVVGMLANPFSIADPNDAGMLDVVGFDPNTPSAIAEFVRGNL